MTMRSISKVSLLVIVVLVLAVCVPLVASAVPASGAISPDNAAAAISSLADTKWVLSSLEGSLPLPDSPVTLQFNPDGTATGSDGCNRFTTTYTQKGAALTFKQPGASTMMMCPEPVIKQATAFRAALAATTNFLANENILVLLAGDEILATFVADSQSLAGTDWEVVNFNNGRQAVVGLLPDTEIYASFGDSEVAGNAGCNQYFAGYSVDGNAIEIGTPGRTFRFCPEPPDVMDQEFEYLAALESAATYSIEGDMLWMRTAADEIAVIMKREAIIDLPAPEPTPQAPKGRVVGAQVLNIRSGPGTVFPVIGAARAGDEGEIVGRSADGRWWVVSAPRLPGGMGWVSADFVLATNAENVPVIASPPVPTPRPPTPTPVPTARPTAAPLPPPTASPDISFWADRTNINQGECATLNWSVNNVQAVWVYPLGEHYSRFPRTGQGNERVCPSTTTTYEMRVQMRDGSLNFRQVTISVAAPAPPPPPPPTANSLAGTRWDVVNYNNGKAIVTLLPDSSSSMNFGTDGQVTGSGGCNNYFASYQVTGNNISIGHPGATSRFCPEPAGVMEQETRFLAALQSAATFRIDGNRLEIQNAAGQIAIVATRAP
jgi:heat shock protein HslJ